MLQMNQTDFLEVSALVRSMAMHGLRYQSEQWARTWRGKPRERVSESECPAVAGLWFLVGDL